MKDLHRPFDISLERGNSMSNEITKLGVFKGVVELAASAGVGMIVGNLVKATTPYDVNKVQRVLLGVGGYAMGGMLSDLSAKYIGSQIDGYAAKFDAMIHPEKAALTDEQYDAIEKAASTSNDESDSSEDPTTDDK
jgi:hypothetical protein